MEVTTNLPMSHWYFHDLQWWGLDYPPLTAYHSWLLGMLGSFSHPEWFQLYLSHGLDDVNLKIFMRATVLASEYVIYVPALVLCVWQLGRLHGTEEWKRSVALTAVLLQPATILIDHGHFQYNTVMLGFFTAALVSMLKGDRLWSCLYFVNALAFKQMALFWAPAVAAFLAGSCIFPRIDLGSLLRIGLVTTLSFALLLLPFLLGVVYDIHRGIPLDVDATLPPLFQLIPFDMPQTSWYRSITLQLTQMVHRIFPFARGLFEDKVANFWCALHSSGVHKLTRYDAGLLSKAALGLTLLSILPPCLLIFFKPEKKLLPYALATTAWGFFLCSYQVHEKNVLLPLLPMTLLLATKDGLEPRTRTWVGFANLAACWTMFPLLKRDELSIPYAVLTSLWWWLMGIPPFALANASSSKVGVAVLARAFQLTMLALMVAWHIVEHFVPPPNGKPDLWVVINVCIGAAAFGVCYLWCLWRMIELAQILPWQQQKLSAKKQQ